MNNSEPIAGYAYWIAPDGVSRVLYSLAVFHEIDGVVNEAYRRIPHGGVETGGLLFGKFTEDTVQIDAFRPIECQHAYGPSFVLSESDLAGIREQMKKAEEDAELSGLVSLGWFIGHNRSPLLLTEREAQWFDSLFPDEGSLTVLVKPERFQPTQFGFLLRLPGVEMPRDAAASAIILPLSQGSSPARERPAPSIPAPKPVPAPETPPIEEPIAPVGEATRVLRPQPPEREPEPVHEPPVRSAISAFEPPARPPAAPFPPLTDLPVTPRRQLAIEEPRTFLGLSGMSVLVLLAAALLGCLAGYLAYLQLPSPVIPVTVREQGAQLLVEWPASQTDHSDFAALQVNNGSWVTLSSEQKAAGQAVVTVPPGDVTIDLMAKHWLRDSRGIVRYLRTPRPR